MTESVQRSSLPRLRNVAGIALAAAPLLAFMEDLEEVQRAVLEHAPPEFWTRFGLLLVPWFVLAACIPAVFPVVARFPFSKPYRLRAGAAHVAAALGFPFLHIGMLALVHAQAFGLPPVEHARWLFTQIYVPDLFVFAAVAGVLHTIRQARERAGAAREALQLRAELAGARLEALAQQLQPHFLFNALNSVAMLVRSGDAESAIEMLSKLSGILRDILRDGAPQDVPIEAEFALLRDYLEIERIRFSDRLTVHLELDPQVAEERVPFLILQPVVENAVRHGVSRRTGPGTISVRAERTNGNLHLRVTERGAGGVTESRASGGLGVGLKNTRERLAAKYGARAAFSLAVDPNGEGSVGEIVIGRSVLGGRERNRE